MASQPSRRGDGLTPQQAAVFASVSHYHEAIGEPVPASYVARKLAISKQRVQEIFHALSKLGWLRSAGSPAIPTRALPPLTIQQLPSDGPACDVPSVKPAAQARQTPGTKTVELAPLSIRADVAVQTVDEAARTVELVFSTGAAVQRYDWMSDKRYLETLSLDPAHVRIERLNTIGPLLDGHSAYSVADVLGAVVPGSVTLTKGQARATVRFSKRAEVEPIFQDVKDGIIRSVSVGYRVYQFEETDGKDNALPVRKATDWEPFEISMVPIPADAGAAVRGERPKVETNSCEVVIRKEKHMENDELPAQTIAEIDPLAPPARRAAPPVEPNEHDEGAKAERKRTQGIILACRAARLPQSFADKLIESGDSLEACQSAVFTELGKRGADSAGPQRGGTGAVEIVVGDDPLVHVRAGIENALLHRVYPAQKAYRLETGDDGKKQRVAYDIGFKLSDEGKPYRGMRMLDVARAYLNARGFRVTSMAPMEVASLALGLRAGLHTTSDFPNILADLPNKILRQAYLEAPQTFGPIVRNTTLADFKPARLLQLGEGPALLSVGEHGEFTEGTMGESKETYQLGTWGRKFSITRQALVNDDTDAFSRVPMAFGRQARNKESDLVWAEITANANMGDGVALFHATHANLSGTSDAISVAAIGAGRAALRKQVGIDGVSLMNLNPLYLIVPAAKETIADQFVSTNLLASQSSSVNPFAGKLTVIAEPRLDVNSAVSWYLAADPAQIDIIVLATLEGSGGPMVDSRIGFDVDGMEFKIRHDIAAKVVDFRGLYKNPGA